MTLYSHSRLSCFEKCPYKFKLKYIDKAESLMEQSVEAFLGTMVHSALEKLYKDLRFSRLNTLEELLSWFRREWKKNWSDDIIIVRKEYTQKNFMDMGEKYISDYYKRYHPFDQARTISLEDRVVINLDKEGRYKLQGYIDRLAYTGNGVYEIHDYKTSYSIPIRQYLEEDRQLALYSLAVLDSYQDARKVKLVWHFLAADKEVALEKTPEELGKLKKDTMELIDRITSEREFRTRVSALCKWCEFRLQCPAQKHLAKTEAMPANKYLGETGVKLVNRFAELKEEEKEAKERIGKELDDVKEALFEYARKEGLNVVSGSDKLATVWSRDCVKFPGKKDEGREELEQAVRKSGLWEELSVLDSWKLERRLTEGMLPQNLIKELARFARKEQVRKIYLKSLKREE